MQKNYLWLALLLLIPLNTIFAQVVKLDDLIAEGIANNPQLKAYRHTITADSSRSKTVGSLPDPTVSFNILNLPVNSFSFDQEAMTGKQVLLRQNFPFFGTLGLKEEIADKNTTVDTESYREVKNRLMRDIKTVYYDIYDVDEAITTTGKNRKLLREFVNIAEKKYAVGEGLQQDVLKAQVELSKMIDRLITLEQKRSRLISKLNALLNRPAGRKFGQTDKPVFSSFTINQDSLSLEIEKNRPLLKAWRVKILQSDDKISLAKKDYWPDMSIFVAYTQRDVLQNGTGGVDFMSGGITLSVPLYFWRKQDQKITEEQFVKKQVQENYYNVRNNVLAELDIVLSDLDKNSQLVSLYKTAIIPQASQALQSAMIGYQTDKVDFLTLINNQMTLFNFELTYAGIISAYNKNQAQLEYIVGKPLQEIVE
jgi:outer membrane protein TolC